ncbi:unnamed protein product [Rotaria socialis]|nr:unnamed protein product [Rotaria socialis]CAF3389474.1 unnamed protein product [Rotaria socialis]
MYPNFHYTSSFPQQQQQQSQPIQWGYQPSFYNGYRANAPIILAQPVPVVQNYLTPLQQQQQQQHRIDTQLSSYPPSMKTYNRFRNAFSCSHQQDSNNSDDEYLYHEQQLNRNLTKHDIERLPVKGDGNCLFYALAEGLMYEMKVDPHEFGLQLQRLFRLSKNFRLVDFADCLRQLCVDQWRLHEDYYSQFVDKEKVSFLKEVKKFSKNGVSDSTLGDIVPLTTANALNINITIFTSVLNLPRIDVKPERKSNLLPLTQKTIYLAYNQHGIGHYDAAYPRT